jgi:hypothetical protein
LTSQAAAAACEGQGASLSRKHAIPKEFSLQTTRNLFLAASVLALSPPAFAADTKPQIGTFGFDVANTWQRWKFPPTRPISACSPNCAI